MKTGNADFWKTKWFNGALMYLLSQQCTSVFSMQKNNKQKQYTVFIVLMVYIKCSFLKDVVVVFLASCRPAESSIIQRRKWHMYANQGNIMPAEIHTKFSSTILLRVCLIGYSKPSKF